MMLIKPASFTLPQNYIDSLWMRNSHGFGAYCFTTKTIFKTLDKSEAETYLSNNHANELFIHFRMATGGQKSLDNVHPFKLGHDLVLFHNGIMQTTVDNGIMSDTAQYALYWRNQLSDHTTLRDTHLNAIISDLELNEQWSRFTIIDTTNNEAYYPNCAEWYTHTTGDNVELMFSNTYAISSSILYGSSKANVWDDYVYNYNDLDWRNDAQNEENLVIQEMQQMIDDGCSHADLTAFIEQDAFYIASWLLDNVLYNVERTPSQLTVLNDDTPDDNDLLLSCGVA